MLPEEEKIDSAAVRIAQLAAAELEHVVAQNEFGVIVEDVTPLDLPTLVQALAQPRLTRSKRLRVSLVGEDEVVRAALTRFPSLTELLTADEETAVGWRNERLRTIALVTSRPLAKAATFREFRRLNERDLGRRLCSEQRDAAEVTWLRTLWDALERGRMLRISLVSMVRFALALGGLTPAERSASAPRHLHILGLFPDSFLADEKSHQRLLRRLTQNRDLVAQVRRATDEDWSRVRAYCKSLSGPTKTSATRLLTRVRKAADGAELDGLDFADVQTLWRGKIPGKGGGTGRSGAVERVEVERIVGRKLLANDRALLSDMAEEIAQIVQIALDDDARDGSQDLKIGSTTEEVAVVEVNRELLELVRSRSTDAEWGGIIEVASDKPGALTEVTAFKSWSPFGIDPIVKDLANFAAEKIAPEGLRELLARLVELHSAIVPYAPQLALSPVVVLAGEPGLLEAAEEYIATYEQLLRQVHSAYHEMHSAADFEAERVLGQLLCLELYVYRNNGKLEAVMSPLHPLFLWRSVTLVREVTGLGAVLSEHELKTVEEACAEDLQILQVLVLPRQATELAQPIMLGQAGTLGRLPVYREAPRGMLEADGAHTVAELAQRLAKLRPFVRPGLQILLVNLPKPGRFIEELIDRLDLENTSTEDTFWGIHVRVRYTHVDTRGWANEVDDLGDSLRERLSAAEERGLLSLSVQRENIAWVKLQQELRDHPAHLTVVVDPFEVRSTPVARAPMHSLSPWMPTCEYRFNRIRKEVQVIPVAEEHVFGNYLAAAALVHTALQRKTPAHLPQVQEVKDILDDLAQNSTWTVVADPHRVPLARLGDAEVIDRRVEKGRQLTCFAHDLAPFVRRLDEQLRKTHFQADNQTLHRLVRDLVAMEPNGILGLAASHEKQVKGSLGKLIAVRWYRSQQPSGLAVSLDTANAARWLVAGNHSREKADLLGLRDEDGSLVVDVIEVKAHDEAIPYSVTDGVIEGRAVGQVLATLQALAEVFTPDSRSPLAKPRREVLREHLYTALLRDQEPEYVERWHSLLQDVFEGKVPVRLAGRIVHVQLASVAHRESRVYQSESGVPVRVDTLSAEDVGLVLRSSRPVLVESVTSEPGLDVADRLEPADALARLLPKATAGGSMGSDVALSSGSVLAAQNGADYDPPKGPVFSGKYPSGFEQPLAVLAPGVFIDVALGTEHASSNVVHWAPGRQSNGFFLILGASGSGKTETLKVLGSSIADFGVPVLVFDFHGDVLLPGVPSVLLSSGSASTVGLNPMELDIHSAEESGLYDQRAALRAMILRAVPALGHRQSSILRDAFDEAYRRAGIVDTEPRATPKSGQLATPQNRPV